MGGVGITVVGKAYNFETALSCKTGQTMKEVGLPARQVAVVATDGGKKSWNMLRKELTDLNPKTLNPRPPAFGSASLGAPLVPSTQGLPNRQTPFFG